MPKPRIPSSSLTRFSSMKRFLADKDMVGYSTTLSLRVLPAWV
jgi:hypothetical protein